MRWSEDGKVFQKLGNTINDENFVGIGLFGKFPDFAYFFENPKFISLFINFLSNSI